MGASLGGVLCFQDVIFSLGFLSNPTKSLYRRHIVSLLVSGRTRFARVVSESSSGCKGVYLLFSEVRSYRGRGGPCCFMGLGTLFFDFFCRVLVKGCVAPTSGSRGGDLTSVGGVLSCVGLGCSRPLATTRLATLSGCDRCCFVGLFGRCANGALVTCVGSLHVRGTGPVLLRSSSSIARVTLRMNFGGADCFVGGFRRTAKVSPRGFHEGLSWGHGFIMFFLVSY